MVALRRVRCQQRTKPFAPPRCYNSVRLTAASDHHESPPSIPSAWALRQRLAERDYGVSDRQLEVFESWGLIDRGADGYPAITVERVVEILEAANEARQLPRRVVRLRADYHAFPVPAQHVQRAFVELAPTIRAPAKKMRAVEDAWTLMAARAAGRAALRRRRRLPAAAEWAHILKRIPPERFELWVAGWYSLASTVLPAYARDAGMDLERMPIEERVVIVAVLNEVKSGAA